MILELTTLNNKGFENDLTVIFIIQLEILIFFIDIAVTSKI